MRNRTRPIELTDEEVTDCIEMLIDINRKFNGKTSHIRKVLGSRWTKVMKGQDRPGHLFYSTTDQIWREFECGI